MKSLYTLFAAFVLLVLLASCSAEDLYDLDSINSDVKKTQVTDKDRDNTWYAENNYQGDSDHDCGGPP